jgi:pimeloyl-ACP methyl ester carboxylesterase
MRIVRSIWDFKTYDYFARVRCPTLMIPAQPTAPHNQPDQAYLQAKQRGIAHAQQVIKNLQVAWMADTIHDIPLQRPNELADMIANFAASLG